jgi:hypothetical protein
VLWYNGLYLERSHVHVNIIGKWIFITIAVLVVAGLCIMSWRVLRVLMGKDRLWKRAVAVAILVGIGVAVLPDAAAKAQLANPHATGMVPVDLFDLFDALPDLLYWMLLGLAIVVVMRLPSEPDLRPVRRIAIPIAVLLLYWNGSWLYLPITFLIGLLLVSWLALPEKLAEAPRPCTADEALSKTTATLKNVLADWRAADFAAGQRQALAASSTDALQDLLVQNDREGYDRSFAAMTDAQEKLANEHDRHQRDALTAKAQVFSHKEDTPNTATARCGTFTGAVLGIVPAAVTILITPPPWDSDGYPVLNFVGSTAWNLFFWIILGWFVGYFLPLIRGNNGTEKALWLFVVGVAATLPMSVMWDDGHAWMLDIIAYLELFIFLMVTTVILCDLCTLRNSGMRLTDWVRVQNWRFVITWSTALIAAIGTAAITVLSTVAVDLTSHALTNEGTSQQASQTGQTGR